jgi:hypothetical protein
MPTPVHLFHIAYSEETARACEPGFELLDNRSNVRPDWYEFWPIRHFLESTKLDETAYYGFFSPKFRTKTGLGAQEVRAFVLEQGEADTDAFLFSPQPDVGMFFENVYVGGERFNPGFLQTSQDVLEAAGWQGDLRTVVMDSRTTVFSNYIVARPSYWRLWRQLCECVFMLAEQPELKPDLHARLNQPTGYSGGAQRKIFVIEGIASLLLTLSGVRAQALSPFSVPWYSVFSRYRSEAATADALKIAYRESARPEYLAEFRKIQTTVLARL